MAMPSERTFSSSIGRSLRLGPAALLLTAACGAGPSGDAGAGPDNVFPTNGTHNEPDASRKCMACSDSPTCTCTRKSGEPTPDPQWPAAWVSDWNMYRAHENWQANPPPYADPPKTLAPSDYELSQGTSYYDSTYKPADGDGEGAMMEYYRRRCLPIFPKSNHYSCAFVSLGNKAYFFGFPEEAPQAPDLSKTAYFCFFSPNNHPPRPNFVEHLPYNPDDTARVPDIQAYSLTAPVPAGPPILFGYAFEKNSRADAGGGAPYQHPFAFYFSGYIELDEHGQPTHGAPDAPYVSQNYVGFHQEKPGAFADLWAKVDQYRKEKKAPDCTLFENGYPLLDPGAQAVQGATGGKKRGRSWQHLKR
ncbi:hypothetical protein BE04_21790 [Sorangium cellulosum]|uniref:Uncharacterized protein n=3 Tax=Sorangium cellulosum TaxID=56 RepID=A0A150PPC1_SORCE|nr:hypothetical protein SCE1572_32160 [Sorangium cellulosum So0157-2]KYF57396.1 hypothetical protein BE04_21790 [Sorangium cellulosum]